MNQEECLQIVRFLLGLENMLWFRKGNHQARLKHNTRGKFNSPVIRILKLHGTCNGKVLNLKLKRVCLIDKR